MTQHSLTAFFDTRDDAANAVNKLRELGVPDTNIRLLPDVDATAPPMRQGLSDSGFLGFLGEFFGSARDADSYEEGLRRGAIMVTAQVDITQLGSATRILDEHGSIDMDERERGWIEDGWRPPEREASAGASTATLAAGAASAATGMPGAGWSPTGAPP